MLGPWRLKYTAIRAATCIFDSIRESLVFCLLSSHVSVSRCQNTLLPLATELPYQVVFRLETGRLLVPVSLPWNLKPGCQIFNSELKETRSSDSDSTASNQLDTGSCRANHKRPSAWVSLDFCFRLRTCHLGMCLFLSQRTGD